MPADLVVTCWHCGTANPCGEIVSRSDRCSKCGWDLRACKNCTWHDASAYNECRESQAEFVGDREKANFCGYFAPAAPGAPREDPAAAAKAKLEALFRKT